MAIDLPRRRLLEQFTAHLIGLGGAFGIYNAFQNSVDSGRQIPRATGLYLDKAGEQRLYDTAGKAVDEFAVAGSGLVLFWTQNFWFLDGDAGELAKLDQLCQEAATVARFGINAHRARTLPVIARLHALPCAVDDDAEAFRARIHMLHASALDLTDAPSREVVDTIWHNATSVLIRNERAWRFADFGQQLVLDAVSVCDTFLQGAVELFQPTISAWLFLLTYERALAARGDSPARVALREAMNKVRANRLVRESYWFIALERIFGDRFVLNEMLPNLSEMALGQSRHDVFDGATVDFFVRAKLQNGFILESSKQNIASSPFFNVARQHDGSRSYSFLRNYGLTPNDWTRLSKLAPARDVRLGFSIDAFQFWSAEFAGTVGSVVPLSSFDAIEIPSAAILKSFFPFRSIDTQRLAAKAFRTNNLTLEFLADAVKRAGNGTDRLLRLWQAPAAIAAESVAATCNLGAQSSVLTLERSDGLNRAMESNRQILDRTWEDYLKPITRLSKGAFSGSLAGRPADLQEESTAAMPDQRISVEEAFSVYDSLKDELEARHFGKWVKIKVDSRDYVVGDSMHEVTDLYKARFGNAVSCSTRVGKHTRVSQRIGGQPNRF